jgi:hypothetical protein
MLPLMIGLSGHHDRSSRFDDGSGTRCHVINLHCQAIEALALKHESSKRCPVAVIIVSCYVLLEVISFIHRPCHVISHGIGGLMCARPLGHDVTEEGSRGR